MIARFNGNVVPFADDSTSTNRTVFGGTTQSDLIDDNLNTNFKKGWEIVGLNDNPTREDFNAMGYTLGALTAYLYEIGISEWNASQNYRVNSRVIGSDGKVYKALTGTTGTPNVNHNPISDSANWGLDAIDINSLTAKTTPVDADNLVISDSSSSHVLKKLSWANIKATLKTYFDTLYTVASTETVAGIIELATTAETQDGTDDLRAITPLKLKNSVMGLGQTLQTFTVGTQRIAGTNYTNSSGKPIWIIIGMSAGAGAGLSITAGGALREFSVPDNGSATRVIVPILSGETYSATASAGTINYWAEIR